MEQDYVTAGYCAMKNKNTAMDSSSAILLYKAGLLEELIYLYNIILPLSVIREVDQDGYPGCFFFRSLRNNSSITIIEPIEEKFPCDPSFNELQKLHTGERDTIILYLSGAAEFIITDDKQAAVYCMSYNIQYINALLIPRILFLSNIINYNRYEDRTDKIITIGRYSKDIIDFALGCDKEQLVNFLPL